MPGQQRSSCKTQAQQEKQGQDASVAVSLKPLAHRAWRPGAMSRDPSMVHLLAESITSVTVMRTVWYF